MSTGHAAGDRSTVPPSRRPDAKVRFDQDTSLTIGQLRTRLPLELAELAPQVDPQSWRSSPFFPESYKVIRTATGYQRDPIPPRGGTSWSGQLFEHFQWRLGAMQVCRFVNILNIDFRVSATEILLDYSLYRPVTGSVWFSSTPVGVDVDRGHLSAVQTPAGVDLEILKTVRFVELEASSRRAGSHSGPVSSVVNRSAPLAMDHWLQAAIAPLLSHQRLDHREGRASRLAS